MIQQRVIQAYEEEKARSKLPGYVPLRRRIDGDDSWAPPAGEHAAAPGPHSAAPPAPGAAKVQAECWRGPHRPPTAAQRAPRSGEGRRNDSLGRDFRLNRKGDPNEVQ